MHVKCNAARRQLHDCCMDVDCRITAKRQNAAATGHAEDCICMTGDRAALLHGHRGVAAAWA